MKQDKLCMFIDVIASYTWIGSIFTVGEHVLMC